MTKREEAKDATRERVLAEARRQFHAHGYEAVKMRDIAGALGRSTGAIFANYPSKAALFEAAMGHPAPDAPAFLAKFVKLVDETGSGVSVMDPFIRLRDEAEALRHHMIGHHA